MFNRRYLQISLMTLILALGAAACDPFAGSTAPTAAPAGESIPAATPASTPASVSVSGQSTPAATANSASTSAPTSAPSATPGSVAIDQTRAIKNVSGGLDKLKSYRARFTYAFDGKDKTGKPSKGSVDFTQEVINTTQEQHRKIAFTGNPPGVTSDNTSAGTPGADERYQVDGNVFFINQGKCQFIGSGQTNTPGALFSPDKFIGADKATLIRHGESVNGIDTDLYTFTEAAVGTSLNGMKLTQGDAWIAPDGYVVKVIAQASGKSTDGAEGSVNFAYNVDSVNSLPSIVLPSDCVVPVGVTDVPIPPNATGKQVAVLQGGQIGSVTTFKSPDPIKTVADFYRQSMPAQGWQAAGDTSSGAFSIRLTYTKDAGKRTLMVSVSTLGAVSSVIISDFKSP